MEEKDYRLVLVGNTQVGLIGLKGIFEELKSQRNQSEATLKEMLVERAKGENFTAPSVKKGYEKALFREFRKFLGETVEEEGRGVLEIFILGQGCFSCNQLEQDLIALLSETGIRASLNHITEPSLFAQYGNPAVPALIINGKVKSRGILPLKSVIKKWLEEEKG